MSDLHVNYGGGINMRRDTQFGCPVCDIKDAPIVRYVSGSPYYPDQFTCTCCGDSWSDGYIGERPFMRGWRQKAIAKATAHWDDACTCPIERDDEMYVKPCQHQAAMA